MSNIGFDQMSLRDRQNNSHRDAGGGLTNLGVEINNTAPIEITGNITVGADPITTPTIYNVSVTLANTEYSQALPADTRNFMIKCREFGVTLNLAFVAGQSSTNYIQFTGSNFVMEDSELNGITLYFQADTAGVTAEILVWT